MDARRHRAGALAEKSKARQRRFDPALAADVRKVLLIQKRNRC